MSNLELEALLSVIPDIIKNKITLDPSGCWLWTGRLMKNGGHPILGASRLVHRLIWKIAFRQDPPKILRHHCGTTNCVNPTHCGPTKGRSPANCHPDRPAQARGMCSDCYGAWTRTENKEKINKKQKEWRQKHPHKVKDTKRRQLYGISSAEVQLMIDSQSGMCDICQQRPANHIDHDHSTGKVRAILCGPCNMGLGSFLDNPEIMRRAADYVILHKKQKIAA